MASKIAPACRGLPLLLASSAVLAVLGWWSIRLGTGPSGCPPEPGAAAVPVSSADSPRVILAVPGEWTGRFEEHASPPDSIAQPEANAASDPYEALYGALGVDGLRSEVERVRGLELRAKLLAAVREASALAPPAVGEEGPQVELTGLGDTYRVRNSARSPWEDVTWFVERDESVRSLQAERGWLEARIARVESSDLGGR